MSWRFDVQLEDEHSLLDQLEAPAAELASGLGVEELSLEQLPASQATALRLTLLEGLSRPLGISAIAVQRAQKKAIAALHLQLVGGG